MRTLATAASAKSSAAFASYLDVAVPRRHDLDGLVLHAVGGLDNVGIRAVGQLDTGGVSAAAIEVIGRDDQHLVIGVRANRYGSIAARQELHGRDHVSFS